MKKDLLQPVDHDVRRQAKTLVRTARYAALSALDPVDGAPTVSRVALATDSDGRPGFLMSRMSGHFSALEADARCALLLGEPGDKGDPLAHPRITLGGRAAVVDDDEDYSRFRHRFLARNPKSKLYVDFPDMAFWRLTPDRVSFNGGFGKAYAPQPADLLSAAPPDLLAAEASVVAHMNDDHAGAVDHYAARNGATTTGWKLASVDTEGADLVRAGEMMRIWFPAPVKTVAEMRSALIALVRR